MAHVCLDVLALTPRKRSLTGGGHDEYEEDMAESSTAGLLTKKPRLKMHNKIYFCDRLSFRRLKTGSGMTKMGTSVMMFPAAFIYQNGRFLSRREMCQPIVHQRKESLWVSYGIQVPSTLGFQNFCIGEQLKMTIRSWETDHMATKTSARMMTFLVLCVPNTR